MTIRELFVIEAMLSEFVEANKGTFKSIHSWELSEFIEQIEPHLTKHKAFQDDILKKYCPEGEDKLIEVGGKMIPNFGENLEQGNIELKEILSKDIGEIKPLKFSTIEAYETPLQFIQLFKHFNLLEK